jgi:two-component system, OmpR family, phosphate regulon sensor histidine kinase PhoR
LVDLAAIEHEFQAQEKSLAITLDITDKQLIVSGDDAQLHEAIVNLINNAIKYTPEGGKIQVKLQKQNNEALFEVVDNGYGIPVNMQEKLFQPFYRVISVETQHIEGTGLGLHLVKNIIERHGGEMHFQSDHGEGSTFGFVMSLIEAD